jgi:hypothetical protein
MLLRRRSAILSQEPSDTCAEDCKKTHPESARDKRHNRRTEPSLLARLDQTLIDRIPQPNLITRVCTTYQHR